MWIRRQVNNYLAKFEDGMGRWFNELSRWLTDVSLVVLVCFVLWVLWGVLQYFDKVPGQRSRDSDRGYGYDDKRWAKRPTQRR